MKDYSKIKQLLGLSQRAGKLISGESLVLDAIRKNKAKLILISNDSSDGTKKKISDKATYYKVDYKIVMTSNDYLEALGKPRKIIAITEVGFAKKIKELIEKG